MRFARNFMILFRIFVRLSSLTSVNSASGRFSGQKNIFRLSRLVNSSDMQAFSVASMHIFCVHHQSLVGKQKKEKKT